MIDLTRRVFLIGSAALAAPMIVRAHSLMPIRPIIGGTEADYFDLFCASQPWYRTADLESGVGYGALAWRQESAVESRLIREGVLRDAPLYRRFQHLRPRSDVVLFPAAPDFWEN